MPERVTAQRALRDLAERNGWSVHEGSFSERRLVFERGALKLTADFHPGGALKQATRYVGKDVDKELHKGQQRIREQFEKWFREKPFKVEPVDPNESIVPPTDPLPSQETQSAATYCALPSSLMGCTLCGAVVWNAAQHDAWHGRNGR